MLNEFNNFLKYTNSQKEISLIIAKNNDEMVKFKNLLIKQDYIKVNNVCNLIKNIDNNKKIFIEFNSNIPQDEYQFAAQYSSGQVEVQCENSLKVFSINYKNASIIYLLNKSTLKVSQKNEQNILHLAGITYQN
ncbi:MAG: hypothetical protein U9O78_00060 [Patescibacteria group bacterium]|nr:hypothetical protein [Patescibacteria group bacterium]